MTAHICGSPTPSHSETVFFLMEMKNKSAGMYLWGKFIKHCAIASCRITSASLHRLPKYPNIRNE